ncbi:adenylate/guanylate cyclase domain-containing protein [Leptospira sp. 96542]|nr:adenylate/guanylate cyclase domain-containing protein [Leptospira sp. 96542]
MNDIDSSIKQILDEESAKNAHSLAKLRILGSGVWLLLSLYFGYVVGRLDWANPIPFLALYVILSIFIYLLTRKGTKYIQFLTWFTIIIDLFFIFFSTKASVADAPYPMYAPGFTLAMFLLFLLPMIGGSSVYPSIFGFILTFVFVTILMSEVGILFPVWVGSTGLVIFFSCLVSIQIGKRPIRVATEYEREKSKRKELSRYFSPTVADKISNQIQSFDTAEKKEVTVLFSDIRGFTSLSESMQPEEVVQFLNEYLTIMVHIIFKNGGTLDKFMGDGILAYFGAPLKQVDHVKLAVQTARDMFLAMKELNNVRELRGESNLEIGIGIHSGNVILCDIGSEQRKEHTIIGDTVNLASRLESKTKELGVSLLVSESVADQTKQEFNWIKIKEPLTIKGKKEKIQTYTLD